MAVNPKLLSMLRRWYFYERGKAWGDNLDLENSDVKT